MSQKVCLTRSGLGKDKHGTFCFQNFRIGFPIITLSPELVPSVDIIKNHTALFPGDHWFKQGALSQGSPRHAGINETRHLSICKLNQSFSNSEAAMLSGIKEHSLFPRH